MAWRFKGTPNGRPRIENKNAAFINRSITLPNWLWDKLKSEGNTSRAIYNRLLEFDDIVSAMPDD